MYLFFIVFVSISCLNVCGTPQMDIGPIQIQFQDIKIFCLNSTCNNLINQPPLLLPNVKICLKCQLKPQNETQETTNLQNQNSTRNYESKEPKKLQESTNRGSQKTTRNYKSKEPKKTTRNYKPAEPKNYKKLQT